MSTSPPGTPVTVLVTRRVRHGRAAEFERLMAGMQQAAAGFPGHLGGYLVGPGEGEPGNSYHMLFAFDSDAHIQAWTHSPERKQWLDRIARVTHGDGALRVLSGLEGWFALPTAQTKAPPLRWKMATVTWLGIFPLVLLASSLIGPVLAPIHPVLSVAVATMVVVVAMTWLVAPTLTRIFAGWLYPRRNEPSTGR